MVEPREPSSPADQAKRLRLAETLVHVSRTVAAMETFSYAVRLPPLAR